MKIVAFFRLLRPLNGMIGGLSVFVGGLLTHESVRGSTLVLACLVCFLIIGAGNAINDFVDVNIDKVNRPGRTIPSGRYTKMQVLVISLILFAIGLMVSAGLGSQMFFIALLASLLTVLYSFWLKGKGISGNVLVACLGGLPFLYGAVALGHWRAAVVPFAFAFLLHLARELLKDIEDMPGDRTAGSESFPLKYGVRRTVLLSCTVMILLMATTILPFTIRLYGVPYFIGVLVCIDLPTGLIIYKLFIDNSYVSKANNLLKFNMLIGLGILALGYYR
jgi:geranylgeranylglycerol-phosphate geranylgeranyltransferase